MILDGVCYPVLHFCRVILYVWISPFVVSIFSDLYLTSSTFVLRHRLASLVSPRCYAINDTFYTLSLKTLDIPSGEVGSTY